MTKSAQLESRPKSEGSTSTFDKDEFQKLYMRDRREADRLGFGGSKATNQNYLTVAEYRARKRSQNVA